MLLGEKISGEADFSFQYFTNGGFIGCDCSKCSAKLPLYLEIYKSGKLVEEITSDFNEDILTELIQRKAINIRDDTDKWSLRLSKYVLWNMDALYCILRCETCRTQYLAIFGMDEIQPGREQVQYKGIWELKKI